MGQGMQKASKYIRSEQLVMAVSVSGEDRDRWSVSN